MEAIVISLPVTSTASANTLFFRRSSSSFKVSFFNNSRHDNPTRKAIEIRVPARDRVIDFGKHKGKMLGTLSSDYLKWMSKNLTTTTGGGDFEKWGKLAEDVLEDEVYADRMEWEVAETLLSGNREGVVASGRGVAGELAEMSKKFGWDYEDQVGWSKVDFALLGTSKGGRLPRVRVRVRIQDQVPKEESKNMMKSRCSSGDAREKRRVRAAKKRKQQIRIGDEEEEYNEEVKQEEEDEKESVRFPGRQYLINNLRS